MATYGFLDVLQEELDKNFPFDYEISWDKRNHAVEVSFLLEAQNPAGVEMVDEDGEVSSDDILFEEAVLFYNPAKSTVNEEDYLTVIPYLPKKGFSREFLAYFALFLKDTAEVGLDALMDFLEDPEAEEFVMELETKKSLKKEKSVWKRENFILIRDIRNKWESLCKKVGTYLVYGLSFLLLMAAFSLGTIAFTDLGFQLVF